MNPIIKLIRKRNFLLLFLGQVVSNLAKAMNTIAMSLLVLHLDAPTVGMGALMLINTLPWVVLAPYAGVFADRHSKRNIIVVCDLCRGITCILLFWWSNIWVFYGLAFVLTLFDVMFSPTVNGYLPFVLEKKELAVGNSFFTGGGQAAILAGPALGGLLVAGIGVKSVFLLVGAAYILSGCSEIFITERGLAASSSLEERRTLSDMKSGLHYLMQNKIILFVIVFFSFVSVGFGAISVLYSSIAKTDLGLSDQLYGLFSTLSGIGALAGAVILPFLLRKVRETTVMVLGTGVYGFLYLLFAVILKVEISAVIVLLVGIEGALVNISYNVCLQRTVRREMIGRVFGLDMALSNATMTVGILVVTIWADQVGRRLMLLILSVLVMLICFAFAIAHSRLKEPSQFYEESN